MNNIKNWYKLALAIAFMVGSSACNDLLEVNPQQSIPADQALGNQDDLEGATYGLYSILGRGELYGASFSLLPELLGAEDHLRWQGTFQSYRDVSRKLMVADNAEARRTWVAAYQAINQANIILNNLDLARDQELKDWIEGQARFVRGILYFELVRLYARPWNDGNPANNPGVPLMLTPIFTEQEADKFTQRASVAAIYSQVISDLTAAQELLGEDRTDYANSYSASAFLSRVYLQQQEYANARDAADRVIESGLYRLSTGLTEPFRNDNSQEVIFEIQQNVQNNAGVTNDGLATFYASLVGIGRGDVRIIDFTDSSTYNLYPAEDKRLEELYYIGVGRRSGRLYSAKWTGPEDNLPIIRLSEMYLTRAEANLRLDTEVGATPAADLNRVRSRAGLEPIADPSLQNILLERRLELAYEGLRIHDLKRTETDLVTLRDEEGNDEPLEFIAWNADALVFPIPQREIDATNGQLTQNPGY